MDQVLAGHLEAVVVLGVEPDQEAQRRGAPEARDVGTAFFYVYPELDDVPDDPDDLPVWLVTCRHVVKGMDEIRGEPFVRHNKETQPDTVAFALPGLRDEDSPWMLHPREDVAVMRAPYGDLIRGGLQCLPFVTQEALERERIRELEIGEGDDVYLIGFPEGRLEGYRDHPVVRQGIVAQIQGWLAEEHEQFLVDGSSFGGNSGGPVVTRPRVDAPEDDILSHSLLLGMVRAHALSHGSSEGGENADLVAVIPVDAINDTIERALHREDANGEDE